MVSPTKTRIPLICFLLTAVILVAFRHVVDCDFINYDDRTYVVENVRVTGGISLDALRWAFTTGHGANWHPMTWISHMLDVEFFGLNPHRHHLVNLLFHLANTLLLFLTFNRMTKDALKSAFVAALFAIHPLHVESVAWVAERKDVLSTFFWMLAMAAYARYVAESDRGRGAEDETRIMEQGISPSRLKKSRLEAAPTRRRSSLEAAPTRRRSGPEAAPTRQGSVLEAAPTRILQAPARLSQGPRMRRGDVNNYFLHLFSDSRYLAALIFFALGLMSKPMLVTLPFVFLLLDYWPLGRLEFDSPFAVSLLRVRRLLLEKIPFFLLSVSSSIVTIIVQHQGGAMRSLKVFPPGVRIANAIVSYAIYLEKTIRPVDLAVFYPHPGSWPFPSIIAAALILVAVSSAVIWKARELPYLAVGWLWFTGTLAPVIGVVQAGDQAMADRYTYIPLIGLFVMAAWGLPKLLEKRHSSVPFRKEALFVLSATALMSLFFVTLRQTGYWQNSITLFDHALSVTHHNNVIHNDRGIAYVQLGKPDLAIEDFEKAIEIDPDVASAYVNLGQAYNILGDYAKALEAFNKAISLDPSDCRAHNNRGIAYAKLGNRKEAIEDFNSAIAINPEDGRAYFNRSLLFGELGDNRREMEDLKAAARFGHQGARNLLLGMGWGESRNSEH